MTPYKAGCIAFSFAWPKNANPFVPDTLDFDQWQEGWSDSAYLQYAKLDAGPGAHGWTKATITTGSELIRVAGLEVGHG